MADDVVATQADRKAALELLAIQELRYHKEGTFRCFADVVHAIATARLEGARLGIEAAAKVARPMGTNFDSDAGERYANAILALDPTTVAKGEAA